MTTANKITIARILMIPLFVMMAIYYGRSVQLGHPQEWQRFTAIGIFLLAAASDGIDGYIARHFNQRSTLGSILDPIADKGLLLSAIITLSFSNWVYEIPIWFPVLVIARDLVIVIGAVLLHYMLGKSDVRPSWTGKTATALQMIAISCVLLQWHWLQRSFHLGGISLNYLDVPVLLAGLFTLISGFGYMLEGIRKLHAGGH